MCQFGTWSEYISLYRDEIYFASRGNPKNVALGGSAHFSLWQVEDPPEMKKNQNVLGNLGAGWGTTDSL